jgi:CHASE3 domain sensor protein
MKINQSNSSIGVGVNHGEINAEKLAGTINEAEKQNLAEATAEIRQLLDQLSQTYPTNTTAEKMVVAAEAINRIENNPNWKQRTINAAKEGGLAAFEKAIDNPAGAFVVRAIQGWQEAEAQ